MACPEHPLGVHQRFAVRSITTAKIEPMSHSDTVPPLVVVALVGLFVVIVAIAITR